MTRKKKIILIQSFLLISGLIVIFFTYINFNEKNEIKIFNDEAKNKIKDQRTLDDNTSNVFSDIEYSGLDLAGNRYILKAGEAFNNALEENVVNLKFVKATFYFKNNKILKISSDFGKYNNLTRDMFFNQNVLGKYDGSVLNADKAEYLNTKSFVTIEENIKINDFRGAMKADKLVFDLNKNKLDISSSKKDKIKADIIYK